MLLLRRMAPAIMLACIIPSIMKAQMPVAPRSSDIYMQLKKLQVLGSVLYIAAHPDDENNALLPYLAKEKLYRTAYLSLTRGDGGQNLIGSEQGVELGMIRTQELIAARRVDGAEQFFSRAYEFGFSKSATEALHIWNKEKVLSDIVWIIRNYQPDVIITRFPGDARAGHGHHAASSLLANEAFTAAADPTKFPEQLKNGVQPWQAKRIMWNTYNFGSNNTTSEDQLKMDIGVYNPLIAQSYGETGGEARSMHKSQGEGRPRRKGSITEYFLNTGGEAPATSLMDGVNISWKRLPGGEAIENKIAEVVRQYNFEHPELSVKPLTEIYTAIAALPIGNWRNEKLQEVQLLIEACSGLFIDATTIQPYVVQGDTLKATFFLNKRSGVQALLKGIAMEGFDTTLSLTLVTNDNVSINKNIAIAANKPLSQPYWLQYPQAEGLFDVRDQSQIGKAESDPAFTVNYTITIEGVDFTIQRPVQYKTVDPVKGEVYQPLPVFPQVSVDVDINNRMILNNEPFSGTLKFTSYKKDVTLNIAKYMQVPKDMKITFDRTKLTFTDAEQVQQVKYTVHGGGNDILAFGAISTRDSSVIHKTLHQIKYDHIPTITYFTDANEFTHPLSVKTAGKRIGYIDGAGDKVPQALQQLGYEVKMLSQQDITEEKLAAYDAIIVGIRAYNIYEWLTNRNDVLNNYVANGGNLIIQYLKSNTVANTRVKAGPYPFSVNAGSRVTEENATVNILLPQHSVLNYPNKITAADFDGWIQERSTYQADQLDEHFETPLSMKDSGDKEAGKGSLAIAKYGKGNVAYVSLVLFRQLPAGVPGAYRLMANLIALPKNK